MLTQLLDASADRMGHADAEHEFLRSLRIVRQLTRLQRIGEDSAHFSKALAEWVSASKTIILIDESGLGRHLFFLATCLFFELF